MEVGFRESRGAAQPFPIRIPGDEQKVHTRIHKKCGSLVALPIIQIHNRLEEGLSLPQTLLGDRDAH